MYLLDRPAHIYFHYGTNSKVVIPPKGCPPAAVGFDHFEPISGEDICGTLRSERGAILKFQGHRDILFRCRRKIIFD